MGQSKEDEARGEGLPAYEEIAGSSTRGNQAEASTGAPTKGPTLDSPFDFPSDASLPPYSPYSPDSAIERPIAIPQVRADARAPFLHAYSPSLLRHGITPESWHAFLATMSGFLAATVSEKAVNHAAEIAQHVGNVPKRFGRDTLAHAKSTGNFISSNAKKGNFLAAARGVVGGAIALPVATSIRAVGAITSLPGAVAGAVAKKPQTPKERAVAYAAAANIEWFHRRGLNVALLDSTELSQTLLMPVNELLDTAHTAKDSTAAGQLAALETHIAEIEVDAPYTLELGAMTFWVVITRKGEDEERDSFEGKGKGRRK
ncbi:hypothetical protein F5B20DRAFT_552543 [Whalleya microplaca]|nr:hypothetical protein F5B20DRAFT_552543 [Whalleya microplaca]